MDADGAVDLAQIMTVDQSRLLYKRGSLIPAKMKEVDRAIKVSLGIMD